MKVRYELLSRFVSPALVPSDSNIKPDWPEGPGPREEVSLSKERLAWSTKAKFPFPLLYSFQPFHKDLHQHQVLRNQQGSH